MNNKEKFLELVSDEETQTIERAKTRMTKHHKLVTLSAVLPVLADFIDDLNEQYVFKQDLKRKANILADEIRKTDYKVLQVYGEKREEIYAQQVDLQLLFRQWIEETIKFD